MIYILIISFILHLFSFLLIVTLYQRQNNHQPLDKEKTLREMEDLLIAYTAEMKEANEQLAERVLKSKQTKEKEAPNGFTKETDRAIDPKPTDGRVTEELKHSQRIPQEGTTKNENDDIKSEKYKDYSPPIPDDEVTANIPSDTSQVLLLHQQGYTVNQIAQKLNLGVGEVDLLLKFHK